MGLLTDLRGRGLKLWGGGGQKTSKPALQNLDTWHPRDPEAVADIIIAVEEITANEKKKKKPRRWAPVLIFKKRWKDNF